MKQKPKAQPGSAVPTEVVDKDGENVYRVREHLGKGGFANVYRVERADGAEFALKMIEKSEKTGLARKTQMEVEIHRKMEMAGVVGFHGYFETEKHFCILLELCDRLTLSGRLKEKGRLSETESKRYFRELAETVQEVHRRNVIHRDLKLSNLLFGSDGKVKLCDFGLASVLRYKGDKRQGICGTPNYIAPEILGENTGGYGIEADLWSLGVLLFTFLAGAPPFQQPEIKDIYQKIKKGVFSFPPGLRVTKEARSLVRGLLKVKPTERLTASQVLRHPFLACVQEEPRAPKKPISDAFFSTRENISRFLSGGVCEQEGDLALERERNYGVLLKDKTHRYGLGYLLADGCVGVHFNDKTTLAVSGDGFDYVSSKDGFRQIQRFRHGEALGEIEKKRRIVSLFERAFRRKRRQPKQKKQDFVVKHVFAQKGVFLRFGSNSIQVFFFDGSMLMLTQAGLCLLWREGEGGRERWLLTRSLARSPNKKILEKLAYVNEFLSSCLSK
ncbi:MAG: PLK protein kinase [Amphiamblys sp. WSBS2006]|nr:MAG: PLK protein kinase [Amphiamblys sp. WSBS2006]